ncbi:hypothetical protein VE04_08805, partial [Pseudogymnoascus sp. 24MN13]
MPQPTNTKLMDTSPGGESFNQRVLPHPIMQHPPILTAARYDEATIFTSPNTEQKPNFG